MGGVNDDASVDRLLHVNALDVDVLAEGGVASDEGFRSSELGGSTVRPPVVLLLHLWFFAHFSFLWTKRFCGLFYSVLILYLA